MEDIYNLWIDLHYATFGIEVKNGIISKTPPIARWMMDKHVSEIKSWLEKKNAKIIKI